LLESDTSVSVKLAALDFFGAMAAKGVDVRFNLPASDASEISKFRDAILKRNDEFHRYERSEASLEVDRLTENENDIQKLFHKILAVPPDKRAYLNIVRTHHQYVLALPQAQHMHPYP